MGDFKQGAGIAAKNKAGQGRLEEIFELIKMAQDGDEQSKSRLVQENAPLIKSVIRHYKNRGVEYDDLFQLGCMGFLKAVKNFSMEFGVRFSTYAVPMIAGEVKRFLRDDGFIKVSRSTKTVAVKINAFIEKYKQENSESPTVETVANHFGMESCDVVFAMDAIKSPISLHEKNDEDSQQTLLDKIADKRTVDDNIDRIILKDLIQGLPPRDRLIIMLRYFKDKTQSEVARILKVSQVQVSRLETRIINHIKKEFESGK